MEECFYDFQGDERVVVDFVDIIASVTHFSLQVDSVMGPSFAQGLRRKLDQARVFDPTTSITKTFRELPPKPKLPNILSKLQVLLIYISLRTLPIFHPLNLLVR